MKTFVLSKEDYARMLKYARSTPKPQISETLDGRVCSLKIRNEYPPYIAPRRHYVFIQQQDGTVLGIKTNPRSPIDGLLEVIAASPVPVKPPSKPEPMWLSDLQREEIVTQMMKLIKEFPSGEEFTVKKLCVTLKLDLQSADARMIGRFFKREVIQTHLCRFFRVKPHNTTITYIKL